MTFLWGRLLFTLQRWLAWPGEARSWTAVTRGYKQQSGTKPSFQCRGSPHRHLWYPRPPPRWSVTQLSLTALILFFFLMWTIFKVFSEFVAKLLLFYVLVFFFFFGQEACGHVVPRPGIKPVLPLEVKLLTTGPPAKSLTVLLTNIFEPFSQYI